jgi:hypothetical protein
VKISFVDNLLNDSGFIGSAKLDQSLASHDLHSYLFSSQFLPLPHSQNACYSEFSGGTDDIPPRAAQGPGPKGRFPHRRLHHEKFHLGKGPGFCFQPTKRIPYFFFPPPFHKNPSFMQEKAYEPLILDIPLLGGSTEVTSRNPEPVLDTIVAVEDEHSALNAPGTSTEERSPLKKLRSIRFAD